MLIYFSYLFTNNFTKTSWANKFVSMCIKNLDKINVAMVVKFHARANFRSCYDHSQNLMLKSETKILLLLAIGQDWGSRRHKALNKICGATFLKVFISFLLLCWRSLFPFFGLSTSLPCLARLRYNSWYTLLYMSLREILFSNIFFQLFRRRMPKSLRRAKSLHHSCWQSRRTSQRSSNFFLIVAPTIPSMAVAWVRAGMSGCTARPSCWPSSPGPIQTSSRCLNPELVNLRRLTDPENLIGEE